MLNSHSPKKKWYSLSLPGFQIIYQTKQVCAAIPEYGNIKTIPSVFQSLQRLHYNYIAMGIKNSFQIKRGVGIFNGGHRVPVVHPFWVATMRRPKKGVRRDPMPHFYILLLFGTNFLIP